MALKETLKRATPARGTLTPVTPWGHSSMGNPRKQKAPGPPSPAEIAADKQAIKAMKQRAKAVENKIRQSRAAAAAKEQTGLNDVRSEMNSRIDGLEGMMKSILAKLEEK